MHPFKDIPLHREIANTLTAEINDGVFEIGSTLPSEADLALRFKVSRHTIREALRYLQSLGLLLRRQGHGTVVRSLQPRRDYKLRLGTFSDVESHGFYTRPIDVEQSVIVADAALARELPCLVGQSFLRIVCRRVPIDASIPLPVSFSRIYIVSDYAPPSEEIGRRVEPLYLLIERLHGQRIEAIDQDVRGMLLDKAIARTLDAKAGWPGLELKRTYIGRGQRVVMISYNTYAAERFTLSMRFEHD